MTASSDRHAGDLLSAYLDAELTADEVRVVEAHLPACRMCAAELDAVRVARHAVRALPPVEPPADWLPRVLATGDDQLARARRRRHRAGAATLVGAAAAVVVGLWAVPPTPERSPQVPGLVETHAASVAGTDSFTGLARAAVPVSFTP